MLSYRGLVDELGHIQMSMKSHKRYLVIRCGSTALLITNFMVIGIHCI